MFALWIGLTIFLVAEALYTIRKAFHFYYFFRRRMLRPLILTEKPRVALLAPCKGLDVGLRENIQSWLDLDYANYRVFVIVESPSDPALTVFDDFSHADVLIAGASDNVGQKIHNLKYAIDRLPPEYEVLAFVDSDCRLNPDWLSQLVAALYENKTGAVTGYRWYQAKKGFANHLRAAWNAGVLTLLGENSRTNFVWGGSCALFRSTFAEARVFDYWKGALSDDYAMTNALKANSRRIDFVPGAMALTEADNSVIEFFRWSFRQLLITRIYHLRLWLLALLFHTAWTFWVFIGFWSYPAAALVAFASLVLMDSIKADLRMRSARIVFPMSPVPPFRYRIVGPIIALLNFGLLAGTVFIRKICWRDIEYVLHGKNRLKIKR